MKRVFFILLTALPIVMTGCVKEILGNHAHGQIIVFTANTTYDNLPATKTEYSGIDENGHPVTGTSAKERINWVDTDRIRIYSDEATDRYSANHYADYVIIPGANSGAVSNAYITPVTGNGLLWGSGSHDFFAVYPAPGTKWTYDTTQEVGPGDVSITGSGSSAMITGSVPAVQAVLWNGADGEYEANMNYAYMYAAKEGVSSGSTVDLAFKPLVTTFEVILKSRDTDAEALKVKSVELVSESGAEGTDLTGDFVATVSAAGISSVSRTNAGRSIKITLPDGEEPTLSSRDELKFTLLALPVSQSHLTLVLTLYEGTTLVRRTLELRKDGGWITVPAGKKLYIWGLDVPGWHYAIDTVPDIVINGRAAGSGTGTIKSYRTSGSTTEYVPVTFQYSTDGTAYTDGLPAGLTGFSLSDGSAATEKTLTASVGAHEEIQEVIEMDEKLDHARIMATRAPVGSSSNPYDLSMHTITGEARTKPVTANSYVVSAPGTYCFPLVYGNAIDYNKRADIAATTPGGGNKAAYQASTPTSPFTPFVRFDGQTISRPYILWDISDGKTNPGLYVWSNYELAVVWEDTPEEEKIIAAPPSVKQFDNNDPQHPLGHDVIYGVFTIPTTSIDEVNKKVSGAHQGNIVIALRTKKAITVNGTEWPVGTIIWSWHIWVTDNDMTPVRVQTRGTAAKPYNDMMPYHLGWCDEKVFDNTIFKTRTWYVKATQTAGEGTPVSRVFKVIQYGDNVMEQVSWSASTCYQWGRKDPMLPGYNSFSGSSYGEMRPEDFNPTNKPWHSPSGYTIAGAAPGYIAIGTRMGIDEQIRSPHLLNSVGYNYYNLWNANAAITVGVDRTVVKTIYDPCPPGYSVPHMWAFSNFNKNGTGAVVGVRSYADTNSADVDGDGELTANDFKQEDGWHFYTGVGTNTIFFPATCARVGGDGYIRYFHNGYIWTAARENSPSAANGGFDLFYNDTGVEVWVSGTAHALTVHPVAE